MRGNFWQSVNYAPYSSLILKHRVLVEKLMIHRVAWFTEPGASQAQEKPAFPPFEPAQFISPLRNRLSQGHLHRGFQTKSALHVGNPAS